MQILIYVGPAPSREQVIAYCAPIVRQVAQHVTLVTGGGGARRPLLEAAAARLEVAPGATLELEARPGNAQAAILAAADERDYDLVILGRLNQPIGRLLPGVRSKVIAQRLEPSVLRIQGNARPIRQILLASGGDYHTFDDAIVTVRLAQPLGAAVTLLHVVSQFPVVFEGLPRSSAGLMHMLVSNSPEANTLRDAAALLRDRGVAVTVKTRSGTVLSEIVEELRSGGYDLLVIGAHRVDSPLDRILLEDITGDLLERSQVPVLVVKGRQPERSAPS